MSEVLLEDVNPYGNIQAAVESDDDVCFFYLYGAQETEFEMKSVWVRNHKPAPAEVDEARMDAGMAPLQPAAHCRHRQGLPRLNPDELYVVWLPEGNGAALYESDKLIAIIPPWSGMEGFHGYSSECIGQGPFAWELDGDNVLVERFDDAQQFWEQWDDDNDWESVRSLFMSQIETALGRHSNYYTIDGGEWPPKALVRIPRGDHVVLVTIGVSIRPQPCVEMYSETPDLFRRIELGAVLPARWPEKAVQQFGSYLSGQSGLPWNKYTWLGTGHTIYCDSWQNAKFQFALLSSQPAVIPKMMLGPLYGDPVTGLWLLPISAEERQLAIDHGSEKLVKRLPARRWEEA